jgi:hypothetical protein
VPSPGPCRRSRGCILLKDARVKEATISEAFNGTFADEREVIAICLDHLGIGERQVVGSLTHEGTDAVSDDEQTLSYICESISPGFSEETLADFLAKNRERHPIEPHLNPEDHLICLSDEESQSMFGDADGWNRFYQAFPESAGTVEFSRVGFSLDVTQALVYAGQQVHWLADSGNCWIFSKSGETWTKEGLLGSWIS